MAEDAEAPRLTPEDRRRLVTALVDSRYPYQVADALSEIQHFGDRVEVVSTALARTLAAGKLAGALEEKQRMRSRLGL